MNPKRATAMLFIAILSATVLLPLSAQQALKVDVDLVNVVLTVQDPAGRFVAGLDAADFRIYEDGAEQQISIFDREDVGTSIGILVDNSLSMADILPMMKTGLMDFARRTASFNELFVMTFGTRVRILHDFGRPRGQLESNLKTVSAQGTSVLLDGLVEALRKIGSRKEERKALLIFTDGIDTASKAGYRDVLLEAQKAGALLYFIPIGSRILIDENTIESLARETGGRAIYLRKTDPVPPAMETIRQELARQYYIGYYATRKPGFHSIRVDVPGRDVRIRAKSGYYSF